MKKFLALALSASMTLALAGCGGGNNSDQAANNDTASNGGNHYHHIMDLPIGSWGGTDSKLDDIIASFNQAHPEITVKYETLDYQNGDNQVTSAITSNNTPDIIMEGPERLVSNWGAAGKMVDLSRPLDRYQGRYRRSQRIRCQRMSAGQANIMNIHSA